MMLEKLKKKVKETKIENDCGNVDAGYVEKIDVEYPSMKYVEVLEQPRTNNNEFAVETMKI